MDLFHPKRVVDLEFGWAIGAIEQRGFWHDALPRLRNKSRWISHPIRPKRSAPFDPTLPSGDQPAKVRGSERSAWSDATAKNSILKSGHIADANGLSEDFLVRTSPEL